ncbi:MAG: GIY-YIG nuclease family protein [Chloroflexota bacterium]
MTDSARRKELTGEFKQTRPEAGVYRLVNTRNQRVLLGSTPNLVSIRNKLRFARATNMPTIIDYKLKDDVVEFGIKAFSLEVLEVLAVKPEATSEQVLQDLAVMEALWREKQDPELLY